jgi:hypothetical protein
MNITDASLTQITITVALAVTLTVSIVSWFLNRNERIRIAKMTPGRSVAD